jgi:hypothetical protein
MRRRGAAAAETESDACYGRVRMETEGIGGSYVAVIKQILDLLKVQQQSPVSKASRLVFWDDGMLRELRAIAAGDTDIDKIRILREKFEASEGRVSKAIVKLLNVRDKLGPSRIAKQIDIVINCANFGKGVIRHDIRELLGTKRKHELREKADLICRKIEIFNGQLERLDRMVND